MKTLSFQAAAYWIATPVLALLMVGANAQAQIPSHVVDDAVALRMRPSVMLTACEAHTYRHRLRLENATIQTVGDRLIYNGKIVNVINSGSNNVMWFRITIQGNAAPQVEILKVKGPPFVERLLRAVWKSVTDDGIEINVDLEFASTLGERDAALAHLERYFVDEDEKDWKVPSRALINAIAARLYATRH